LSLVKKIADALRNVTKAILRDYVHEAENDVKKRLQKLLITAIIISVLLALVISLIGSASLFLLIGSLKYLSTFMPEWKAWDIMGLTSGVIGGLLLVVLFIIIRKQLKSL
jgi:hypothetical protein